jgi:hypothetical protein
VPNWAEQVTAIATALGAVGLLSTVGLAVAAGRQVGEARHATQSQITADFVRRWDEDGLVEARRLAGQFKTKEELSAAFLQFIDTNAPEAFVLYRELDYFEQLGALDQVGAINFDVLRLLLGPRLIDRWEMWRPSIDAMPGDYPMFRALVAKMRTTLGVE